jgi:hypothetical protein
MRIDDSHWPLIIATAPRHFDQASVESLRDGFDRVFRRCEMYALVVDTRAVGALPDAKCRRALGDWLHDPMVHVSTVRFNVGAATIMASQVQRLMFTAVSWMWKSPSPHVTVATMGEAVEFCCKKLEHAGAPLGASLRELRQSASDVARAGRASDLPNSLGK